MIIQTLLDETRASVLSNLAKGQSDIVYGTVRDNLTGQFTAQIPVASILKESNITGNLIDASFNPIGTVSSLASNVQLHQIQQTLGQVMQLQQLTLGVSAIGFALVLYKLNQMDKKLDKIILSIEDIKRETFKTHLDKLKAGISRIQKQDLYINAQNDNGLDSQLNQITDSLDYLKQYFERHTLINNNDESFYDYLFLVVLCHLVQFKIDIIQEQNKLAKDSLNTAIRLVESYSTEYLSLNPKYASSTNKYLQLKKKVKDYLFEFQFEQDIKNKIDRKDARIIELDFKETIEVYKKLSL